MMCDVTEPVAVGLADIRRARDRIKETVLRTPLVPLNLDTGATNIYLKLENLQSVGSFKIRGAGNAIRSLPRDQLKAGVFTCSAGNFAQGLAWNCQQMHVDCTIIVPDTAPKTKIDAIERYKGRVVKVTYDTWWNTMVTKEYDGICGHFIHPFCDQEVIAGNGTIGLEIIEDLPSVDTIIIPFGGGGLLCGIASAVKAIKPEVKIVACEVETAAPLSASILADKATYVTNHTPSFVDGMGGKTVLPEMWPLIRRLVDDVTQLSLREISDAIKILVERNHVVAEGAGAATVAGALKEPEIGKNIVCVISGGNLNTDKLVDVLSGKVPSV